MKANSKKFQFLLDKKTLSHIIDLYNAYPGEVKSLIGFIGFVLIYLKENEDKNNRYMVDTAIENGYNEITIESPLNKYEFKRNNS